MIKRSTPLARDLVFCNAISKISSLVYNSQYVADRNDKRDKDSRAKFIDNLYEGGSTYNQVKKIDKRGASKSSD